MKYYRYLGYIFKADGPNQWIWLSEQNHWHQLIYTGTSDVPKAAVEITEKEVFIEIL